MIMTNCKTTGFQTILRAGTCRGNSERNWNQLIFNPFVAFVLVGFSNVFAQSTGKRQIDPGVAGLGKGFVSSTAKVNGTTLHYVRGGKGPAVILLHGFPQDWFEYHAIMPKLAQ
jgi:hypothetical protein